MDWFSLKQFQLGTKLKWESPHTINQPLDQTNRMSYQRVLNPKGYLYLFKTYNAHEVYDELIQCTIINI